MRHSATARRTIAANPRQRTKASSIFSPPLHSIQSRAALFPGGAFFILPSAFRQPPPSKREVLSLHRRNLREIHLIYCLDRKTPKKRLPLRGRGACRPRCGRQASGTPKVWHGAAVTEGVRQARPLSEFAQNFEFAHLLFFVFIFDIFAFVKFNFERLPS